MEVKKLEVFTIQETAVILKIARCTLLKLLKNKKIRGVRAGAKWIIPADAIKDFLKGA